MTRTTVTAAARTFVVSPDATLRYRAVAIGRLASEVAGMPAPRAVVTTGRPDVRSFVRDGDFCLAADPTRSFPTAAALDVTFGADGFLPRTTTVTIDPLSLPTAVGTIALQPLPVRVQGRVTAADTGAGLASARVRAIDDPTVGSPPPVHTIVLGRPLVRAHGTGAAIEEAVVAGADDLGGLPVDAVAGSAVVRLATRAGLAPGAVVALGPLAGGEYAEIVQVADPGPPPLAGAGIVTLRDPLTQTLRAGTAARALSFGGTGTAATLAAAAGRGAAVAVVDAPVDGLLRIEPGPDEEYRFVGVLTDDAGYYRLDGVSQVLSLWLAADAAGRAQAHQAVTVRYGTPVTAVDFQLTP